MTRFAYEVPLSAEPQTFTITLAGKTYRLTVQWCAPLSAWVLDIAQEDGTPLVKGIPLVTGADLLSPFAYLGIGGSLLVQTDFDADAIPTFANLGSTGRLYFIPED